MSEEKMNALEKRNLPAKCNLGVVYYNGDGITADHEKAIMWLTRAAEQGYRNAQYNLGVIYYSREDKEDNYEKAFKWHKIAADRGDIDSLYYLGVMYYNGDGVTIDVIKSRELFAVLEERIKKYNLKLLEPNKLKTGNKQGYTPAGRKWEF